MSDDQLGVEPRRVDPLLLEQRRGLLEHLDEGDHAGLSERTRVVSSAGLGAPPAPHRHRRPLLQRGRAARRRRPSRRGRATHHDVGFLFVDDGSTDDTRRCSASSADTPMGTARRSSSWRSTQNGGKAEAVRRGDPRRDGAAGRRARRVLGRRSRDTARRHSRLRGGARHASGSGIVLGSRVRLLGRKVERKAARHYFGRIAATAVSSLFDFSVYDTQCGAKLFRVTPTLPRSLRRAVRHALDLRRRDPRRAGATRRRPTAGALERHIVELPLESWHDVDGSKIKPQRVPARAARAGADLADLPAVARRGRGPACSPSPARKRPTTARPRSTST